MNSRITINNNVHFGKPCIKGTRIPVQDVLDLVKNDVSFEAIVSDYYPDIKVKDIQACVQYAMDIVAIEDIQIAPSVK